MRLCPAIRDRPGLGCTLGRTTYSSQDARSRDAVAEHHVDLTDGGAVAVDEAGQADAVNLEKIDHVVVLMLENRSFDHMLGYPSLTGASPRSHGPGDGS
jgi:phospholipase C